MPLSVPLMKEKPLQATSPPMKAKRAPATPLRITIVSPATELGTHSHMTMLPKLGMAEQSKLHPKLAPYPAHTTMSFDMTLATPGLPPPRDPQCAAEGHDTRIGRWGLAALVLCLPCTFVWLTARDEVECTRCHAKMPPQGLID